MSLQCFRDIFFASAEAFPIISEHREKDRIYPSEAQDGLPEGGGRVAADGIQAVRCTDSAADSHRCWACRWLPLEWLQVEKEEQDNSVQLVEGLPPLSWNTDQNSSVFLLTLISLSLSLSLCPSLPPSFLPSLPPSLPLSVYSQRLGQERNDFCFPD